MAFVPKCTKEKISSTYKTLYLREELVKQIKEIAEEYKTSFNNVIVSMIEECLKMDK